MSNIIKSRAVVSDRQSLQMFELSASEAMDHAVIKRRAMDASVTFADLPRMLPQMDGYQEQLNRIQLEVVERQKELRSLTRQVEEAQETIAHLEARREVMAQMEGLDANEEAMQMLEAAERNAEHILHQARQEGESIVESMRGQGYRDGLEQGREEARQQIWQENESGVLAISQLLEEISSLRETMARESEREIVGTITAVAEKIIGRQLREDPTTVVDMLREVLEKSRREVFIKIMIARDLMPVEARVSEGVRRMLTDMGQQIDVLVDNEAQPGSLVVETPKGFTDLSVHSQLGNITETLYESQ